MRSDRNKANERTVQRTCLHRGSYVLVGVLMLVHSVVSQPTWKRVFGAFDVENACEVITASDGNFVIAGSTGSFGNGSSDFYVFKIDQNGDRLWSAVYGGPQIDEARSIVELADGGFVVVGTTNGGSYGGYDGSVVRTDVNGDLIWQRTYGGSDWDFLNSVDIDANGGIWAAGTTYSYGAGGDQWLVHLDGNGDTIVTRHFGGLENSEALSVHSTNDGGCILAGSKVSTDGDKDAYVIKLDALANVLWERVYGGDSLDLARDIIQTSDGGYSFVGTTYSYNVRPETYHVKLDINGDLQWQWNWGQINDQEGFDHLQLPSDEYAIVGYVGAGGAGGKDMFLQKSDVNGYFIFGQTQGGEQDEFGYGLVRSDGGYVMCGSTLSYGSGLEDIMVIRTNEVGFTDSNVVTEIFDPLTVQEPSDPSFSIHPNPNNGLFQVSDEQRFSSWTLTSTSGRTVDQGSIPYNGKISTSASDGIYMLGLTDRAGISTYNRLIIIRP